jgi:hypothetical protein
MLEGEVFNPERLLRSVCDITNHSKEEFSGGEYKHGYSLITVTADGVTNKYMVFDIALSNKLSSRIASMT